MSRKSYTSQEKNVIYSLLLVALIISMILFSIESIRASDYVCYGALIPFVIALAPVLYFDGKRETTSRIRSVKPASPLAHPYEENLLDYLQNKLGQEDNEIVFNTEINNYQNKKDEPKSTRPH